MKTVKDKTESNSGGQGFNALNLPVHRASTIVFDSTQSFLSRKSQLFDGFSYGLYGTPTTKALEEQIVLIEGGKRALLLPSGLAALTHALLAFLKSGDHVLVADCVYGPTRAFCESTLGSLGIGVTFFSAGADSVKALLSPTTRMVLLESPGSFTSEIQEIAAICEQAHCAKALVLMDNTWGFGNARLFEHGVDIVCTALSKYASGHSDVCMGSVTVNAEELYRSLKTFVTGMGSGVSSDDAYLVMRGLSTLEVRMAEHARRGLALTQWLRERHEVKAVMNPAAPGDRYFARFGRYFSSGNGLVSLVLKSRDLAAISAMIDGFRHFRIGASWGGTTSLVALGDLSNARSVEPHPEGSYIMRLHVGLEPIELLYEDLREGFVRLKAFDSRRAARTPKSAA